MLLLFVGALFAWSYSTFLLLPSLLLLLFMLFYGFYSHKAALACPTAASCWRRCCCCRCFTLSHDNNKTTMGRRHRKQAKWQHMHIQPHCTAHNNHTHIHLFGHDVVDWHRYIHMYVHMYVRVCVTKRKKRARIQVDARHRRRRRRRRSQRWQQQQRSFLLRSRCVYDFRKFHFVCIFRLLSPLLLLFLLMLLLLLLLVNIFEM